MKMTIIVIAVVVIFIITGLFLTAVNWGYKVKHTVDTITHDDSEQMKEVKK
ncbi:YtzI protein [Solibacillus daqui]|uniref:YtzI protein n=1 Tax=Solibacillus daqui TaxID=2912187 RepID=UPI002365DDF6|nr:YtzI protein [Solibacillus daqui]